jgi:hypothetical protein
MDAHVTTADLLIDLTYTTQFRKENAKNSGEKLELKVNSRNAIRSLVIIDLI